MLSSPLTAAAALSLARSTLAGGEPSANERFSFTTGAQVIQQCDGHELGAQFSGGGQRG